MKEISKDLFDKIYNYLSRELEIDSTCVELNEILDELDKAKENNNYAEEDLECALEDMAYWVAQNLDDPVPLIFRNDQIQEKFYKLVKEYKQQ